MEEEKNIGFECPDCNILFILEKDRDTHVGHECYLAYYNENWCEEYFLKDSCKCFQKLNKNENSENKLNFWKLKKNICSRPQSAPKNSQFSLFQKQYPKWLKKFFLVTNFGAKIANAGTPPVPS